MKLSTLFVLTLSGIALFSCDETTTEPENQPLVIPTSYDASQFEANTSAQKAVLNNLQILSTEMKKGRTGGKVDDGVINDKYALVKTQTTSYYDNLIPPLVTELVQISGGQKFNPDGSQGGVYGSYLLNKYGVENEQLIEKGLFGAALYNHAVKLAKTPDATTTDKMIAVMGTTPDFPNSNNGNNVTNPDGFMANYIARRDKNDGNGFYTNIKSSYIKLQAALKGGSNYNTERDEAFDAIFDNWEKANAATTINYLQSVIGKLSATNLDESAISSAMHSFSEAIGFLHGFKSVERKKITDAQIDETLTLMNVAPGKAPTTLNILSSPVTELTKMQQAIKKLQTIYGFTDQQVEDFKKNWVSEQGR
jgi:hypothetical protein